MGTATEDERRTDRADIPIRDVFLKLGFATLFDRLNNAHSVPDYLSAVISYLSRIPQLEPGHRYHPNIVKKYLGDLKNPRKPGAENDPFLQFFKPVDFQTFPEL